MKKQFGLLMLAMCSPMLRAEEPIFAEIEVSAPAEVVNETISECIPEEPAAIEPVVAEEVVKEESLPVIESVSEVVEPIIETPVVTVEPAAVEESIAEVQPIFVDAPIECAPPVEAPIEYVPQIEPSYMMPLEEPVCTPAAPAVIEPVAPAPVAVSSIPPVCTNVWWLDLEFLYFKAFERGLEYADNFDPLAGDLGNARANNITFDFKPGVRVKLGYSQPACIWDIALGFTYYHNHTRESQTGLLFPTLNYFGSNAGGLAVNVAFAEANWNLNFQYLDLEVGRPIWWGRCFALHPQVGVRGAWIDQKGSVVYRGGGIVAGSFILDFTNNFCGAGLKGGLAARYLLTPCWAIFSDVSTSLLLGYFDVKQIQNQAGVNQINLRDTFYRLSPTAQASLGLSWQYPLSFCHPMLFVLSAAAEGQYWWGQNRMQRFADSAQPIHVETNEDLGLFGFTLKGTLYF